MDGIQFYSAFGPSSSDQATTTYRIGQESLAVPVTVTHQDGHIPDRAFNDLQLNRGRIMTSTGAIQFPMQPGQYSADQFNSGGSNRNFHVNDAPRPFFSMVGDAFMPPAHLLNGLPIVGNPAVTPFGQPAGAHLGANGTAHFAMNGRIPPGTYDLGENTLVFPHATNQNQVGGTINPFILHNDGSSSSLGSNSPIPSNDESMLDVSDSESYVSGSESEDEVVPLQVPVHVLVHVPAPVPAQAPAQVPAQVPAQAPAQVPATLGPDRSGKSEWDQIPPHEVEIYFLLYPIPGPGPEHRRLRDGYLLRMHGIFRIEYRRIHQALVSVGFQGAESTLRGRYRTLTKAPAARPRRPVWQNKHIASLIRAVREEAGDGRTEIVGKKTKFAWKRVSDAVEKDTGYCFSASPCKKKWLDLVYKKPAGAKGN